MKKAVKFGFKYLVIPAHARHTGATSSPVNRVDLKGSVVGRFESVHECSQKTGEKTYLIHYSIRKKKPVNGFFYAHPNMF